MNVNEPITVGEFYKPPYKWWQVVKRYKWRRNKRVVATLSKWDKKEEV